MWKLEFWLAGRRGKGGKDRQSELVSENKGMGKETTRTQRQDRIGAVLEAAPATVRSQQVQQVPLQ